LAVTIEQSGVLQARLYDEKVCSTKSSTKSPESADEVLEHTTLILLAHW